ncbi:hypothetical protein [Virgibacillus sp. DJP39]
MTEAQNDLAAITIKVGSWGHEIYNGVLYTCLQKDKKTLPSK